MSDGREVAVVHSGDGPLAVTDVQRGLAYVEQLRAAVMRKGTHYDLVPGTQRQVLLQAGAEKLQLAFRLSSEAKVEDLSSAGTYRYRVICTVRSQLTGGYLGNAVGECSTDEDKYSWRKAVCQQEWDETPVDRRRVKWQHTKNGVEQVQQVRTNAADLANTVLAMAEKRAHVRAIRGVLAVSDMFDAPGDDGRKRTAPAPGAAAAAGSAGALVVTFGKHKGKTLAEIHAEDPSYVEWLAANGQQPPLRAAAAALVAGGGEGGRCGDSAAPAPTPRGEEAPPPPGDDDLPPVDLDAIGDPFADQ